jgi:hypothetical protein
VADEDFEKALRVEADRGSVAQPGTPVVLKYSGLRVCLRVVIGPRRQDGGGEARDQPVVAEAVAELGVRN